MLQPDLLRRVVEVLEEQEIPYMLVGSYAIAAYGRSRLKNDIYIVVDLRLDTVEQLLAEFPTGEYYFNLETAKEAIRSRRQFNVIHTGGGNKIDFMIARGKRSYLGVCGETSSRISWHAWPSRKT